MADNQYPTWVGLIFVFNLIVGTGALTLPAVFAKAGWILSTILIILLALNSYMTVTFVIESISCANAIIYLKNAKSYKIHENEVLESSEDEMDAADATEETAMTRNSDLENCFNLDMKIELGEMAKLFFNKTGQFLFYISLCLYLYGDLAIYGTAVSMTLVDMSCSMRENVSESNYTVNCWQNSEISKFAVYRIYVVIFALTVAPFGYFAVQKTKYLQLFTTFLRWTAFLIMLILAVVRLAKGTGLGHPQPFVFYGIPALMGSSIYSFMCHHSVPGLIAPFSNKNRINQNLGYDYLGICVFYLFLSMTGAFAFDKLEDLYTINFEPTDTNNLFILIIGYFLSAFPVFTLSSSFPIIAITLQSNLKSMILDSRRDDYGFFVRRIAFPTLAILPPLIISFSDHNLKILVSFTGSYAGAVIQYVIPATFVFFARKECSAVSMNCKNRYASPFKGTGWIFYILSWFCVCIIFVTTNYILEPSLVS